MSKKIKTIVILALVLISITCLIGSCKEVERIPMYAPDDRVIYILENQVEEYEAEGWYIEPVVLMYASDGRTQYTLESEVELYKTLNWYIEPVTLMYASDGRTMYCLNSEVELYRTLNWFLSEREAKESVLNQNDVILLAKTIHAEANDSNYTDRCYVGAVVMNRLDSGKWGNSIYSVITARGQYACYGNSKFNKYPPEECIKIAKDLLLGERFGVPKNVIFQAAFRQGTGIWKIVYNTNGYNHYYCFGNV